MDLSNSTLIITLAVTTLVLVVLFGIWQRFRAGRAKAKHEHSAIMDDPNFTHKETRRTDR
ncbi:hypothetical protein [Acuticoccus sp.]|uniref:hypothetical protein n=1 Tax=Acuticoccus sp. TaxID=1904378 RepID=UPI003B51BBF6